MKKILTLCAIAIAVIACNPQGTALSDLEKFTEKIEQNCQNWSPAEWDDAAVEYEEIVGTLERYNYSDEELQRIGRLEARCSICFFKYYASQFQDVTHDALQEYKGFIDGLIESSEK